jgi:purine catabolism regulator
MDLTVREVMKIDVFSNAKLVAGAQGLDRVVRIANIAETPEVASWMKGGELLITGGYFFKDSPELRKQIIYELAAKGVAALALRSGKYFEQAPADMIIYANEVGLPLMELPADVPYMDLMLPIFETVINNQYHLLKKSEDIHHALLNVVLAGKGIDSICVALGELINHPVILVNAEGNLLTDSSLVCSKEDVINEHSRKLIKIFRENRKQLAGLQPHIVHHITKNAIPMPWRLVVVPVEAAGIINGYLIIEETEGLLDQQEIIAVERASTIFALELLKSRASIETEKQIRGELLDYLIHGNISNTEAVMRWASNLDFDLLSEGVVFYVAIDSFEEYLLQDDVQDDDNKVSDFKSKVYKVVNDYFFDYPSGILTMVKSNCLIGLINVDSQDKDAWKLLQQRLSRLLSEINSQMEKRITVSIGVGNAFIGVRNVRSSFNDARSAFKIGHFLYGGGNLTFFNELGSYVVLYELKDSAVMAPFVKEILGNVMSHDEKKQSELFRTLQEYFRLNCNIKQTADSLFIHKNSVIYRLKQIESLTGRDLSKGSDCFDLQLGVKLMQVLRSYEYPAIR